MIYIICRDSYRRPFRIRQEILALLDEYDCTYVNLGLGRSEMPQHRRHSVIDLGMIGISSHQVNSLPLIKSLFNLRVCRVLGKLSIGKSDIILTNIHELVLPKSFIDKRFFLLHDDFAEQAKWFLRPFVRRSMQKAVNDYDVLSVSNCMAKRYTHKYNLLQPWCPEPRWKKRHITDVMKPRVLYFGYLNSRIDQKLLHYLGNNRISIDFFGPITENRQEFEEVFRLYPCFQYKGVLKSLDGIEPARYSCSISPYYSTDSGVTSMQVSNRTFKMFSLGIPIVHVNSSCLQKFHKKIFYGYNTYEECLKAIQIFQKSIIQEKYFYEVLEANSLTERKNQLIQIISS